MIDHKPKKMSLPKGKPTLSVAPTAADKRSAIGGAWGVERLKARNPEAQREFYRLHWPKVLRICENILGKTPRAEDVATDVLTDFIFEHVHKLKNPKAGLPYLRKMAINRSRRLKKSLYKHNDSLLDTILDEDDTPEEKAHLSAMSAQLEKCLSKLTEKTR